MRSYAARKYLPARRVFRTGRDAKPGVENVFLALEQDGAIAYGEAGPNPYFGESAENVHLRLLGLADFLRRQSLHAPEDIPRIWKEAEERLRPSRAALCAVDIALWDLWGKIAHRSAAHLAWGEDPKPIASSVTLSVLKPGEFEARLEEVRDFPLVKVKMDGHADLTPLRRLRAAGVERLLVDANASWSSDQTIRLLPLLAETGVEAVEQPLPPALDAEMPALLKSSPLPLLADESCRVPEDVARMAGRFTGINIKLVKCGGLTPAMAMLAEARRLGLKVMVGCMLESSLLISAGLALAQKADWADLDGAWLLAEDPFQGLIFKDGRLGPNAAPGLGVAPVAKEET